MRRASEAASPSSSSLPRNRHKATGGAGTQASGSAIIPGWLARRADFAQLMSQRDNGGPVFVKEALLQAPASRGSSEVATLTKWLRSLGAGFASLGARELRLLTRCLTLVHLEPGERLQEEPDTVYVVLTGRLRAVMQGQAVADATPVPANRLFGYTSWWEALQPQLAAKRDRLGRRMSAIVSSVKSTASGDAAVRKLPPGHSGGAHDNSGPKGVRRASLPYLVISHDYVPCAEPTTTMTTEPSPYPGGGVVTSAVVNREAAFGVDVVALSFTTFQRNLANERERQLQRVAKFLQERAVCFNRLNVSRLVHLAHHMETREVPPGQAVFRQGQPVDGLYILVRGRCRVDKSVTTHQVHRLPIASHSWANTSRDIRVLTALRHLRPGEVFGEDCLLHARSRHRARRGAVCISAMEVREIHKRAAAGSSSSTSAALHDAGEGQLSRAQVDALGPGKNRRARACATRVAGTGSGAVTGLGRRLSARRASGPHAASRSASRPTRSITVGAQESGDAGGGTPAAAVASAAAGTWPTPSAVRTAISGEWTHAHGRMCVFVHVCMCACVCVRCVYACVRGESCVGAYCCDAIGHREHLCSHATHVHRLHAHRSVQASQRGWRAGYLGRASRPHAATPGHRGTTPAVRGCTAWW